ncbi:MAG: CDP-alcohol phosphatidyltransferase family protein [Proteobacteria bacterium]|nr:MAG: CDP-alcohol phosphatidyltransferase family protein [Pseudomonadota bacterium]
MAWREEYWKSIKSFDTEEKLDLYFYRPVGFVIAKAAFPLRLTPTILTLIGLILGIASGFFFYDNQSNTSLTIASVLFVLAGIFDSSDGQMARMGGKSTRFGLVLDGLCDNLVFLSAYVGSTLTLVPHYGYWIWPLAVFAGLCHSCQSSLLDFYNRDYLYFGCGKVNGDYWNPTLAEVEAGRRSGPAGERVLWEIRFSWLWQQNTLSNRAAALRLRWREINAGPRAEEFQALYRDHNRTILRFWRLMGANFHTILIITAAFARRFDLYLILGDILFLTSALLVLRVAQGRSDKKFVAALAAKGLA